MTIASPDETSVDNAQAWMRRIVTEVVESGSSERLRALLSGRGLPPVGDSEEPYVWLLRGLPRGAARAEAEPRVAQVLAEVLRDGELTADGHEKIFYNACMLAAGLSSPDELTETLEFVFRTFSTRERVETIVYAGLPVRDALRAALIENQIDDRFRQIWVSMLAGVPHACLGGTPSAGFEGVLWMPADQLSRGHPDLDEIGAALGVMAHHLEKYYPQRRWKTEFQWYLERVTTAYPGCDWNSRLLEAANKFKWPRWSVDALPSLVFHIETESPENDKFAVFDYYSCFVETAATVDRWCDGRVLIVTVPVEMGRTVSRELGPIDRVRAEHDLPGRKSLLGALLPEVALRMRLANDPHVRKCFRRTYERMSEEVSAGAGAPVERH